MLFSGVARSQDLPDFDPGRLNTLDVFSQVEIERHALRIAAMPAVRQQVERTKQFFANYRLGKTPDGRAMAAGAAEMYSLFASQFAVAGDPRRPQIIWHEATPHTWHGVTWPGSKWGIDCPDNFYRYVAVDGESTYEIKGRRAKVPNVQTTFMLYASLPGTTVFNGEGGEVLATLADADMVFDSDGSFTITVGPGPGKPGTNHIRTTEKATALMFRDTLSDWSTQGPNYLRIQRIAGPPAGPVKSDEELAKEAAELMRVEVDYWTKFYEKSSYNLPPNTVEKPYGRAGGWGFLSGGWFRLADDEAWVITLDSTSARSMDVQVADVWGIAAEYVQRTSSLNMAQSKANKDGTYTLVIAPQDPGVWNWIDTVGMNLGMVALRWQELQDKSRTADNAVRSSKIVKLSDLKTILPAETVWVTQEEREQQRKERARTFALRFGR